MILAPLLDRDFLSARDARGQALERAFAEAGRQGHPSVVSVSLNLAGPQKFRPGVSRLAQAGLSRVEAALGFKILHSQRDLLGPFTIGFSPASPQAAKQAALAAETDLPGGRLLDIDVFHSDGRAVARRELGLPPRSCYLCAESAWDCIRLGRHSAGDISQGVERLLQPHQPRLPRIDPSALAQHLVRGAQLELELTPKPGLVDGHDCGSHPDLSYAAMRTSIDLFPRYFEALQTCARLHSPLATLVQVGLEAEARMQEAIHANAHKGYLFLSGLVLMAACTGDGSLHSLRQAIADLAGRFFAHFEATDTHGAGLRSRLSLGGIRTEALAGLPAIFEVGLPHYQEALAAGWGHQKAAYYLMALLMQRVEDTTTVHRGGVEGLARLRRDGARLQRHLEQQQDPQALLTDLNRDYITQNLTMGGVADCMALTFALHGAAGGTHLHG